MNLRAVLLSGAAILAGVVACAAGVFLLLHWWDMPPGAARAPAAYALPDGPQGLRSAPQQDLAAARAQRQAWLHGFGWVDAARGIAHIPIEDAMDLMAAEAQR